MTDLQATIERGRAETLTQMFDGKRIIVLGDLMLDEFIFGRVRRISPEAPVPVVEVERQTLTLGGAGNVAGNLVALGAEPLPVGIVGDDGDAERLRAALQKIGVSHSGLITDPQRPTTLKTRIIAHNQQVVRADRESKRVAAETIETQVIETFYQHLEQAEAVVVSDYNKGLLTPRVLHEALAAAQARDLLVCLDPKLRNFANYQPVPLITPNHQEAGEATGMIIEDAASLRDAGKRILDLVACRGVLITRGEEGMSLFTDDGTLTNIPTVAREVYDVTGAGDTVIASLALALASGASFVEAAVLANYAAGVVVGKLGTATVTRQELLATI